MKLNHPAFLFISFPWLLSILLADFPVLSYFIAWIGSFFIFYVTLFSPVSVYNVFKNEKSSYMRPIFIVQLVFAGFMCCTSIFYFISHIEDDVMVIASCQRLALLGHTSLASGIMIAIKENKSKGHFHPQNLSLVLVKLCLVTLIVAIFLDYLPSLIQFKYPLLVLSATCGSYLLIHGLYQRSFKYGIFGTVIYLVNFVNATLTGFKEGIIVQLITLIFIALPMYKKTVFILGLPCIFLMIYILPTYTIIVREQSWIKGKAKESAREQAYETFFNENSEHIIDQNNWKFLTDRFSEIGMFSIYVSHVPKSHDFYGLEIIYDACLAVIPRIFWDEKPSTEVLSMQRVYDSGIAKKSSPISAKTRPVVDGYLMYGNLGIFISMLLYGIITQSICNKAESLFGGYEMGCIIIFNSLFQQLWRGNNFEFLINNIVYAYLLMIVIYKIMRITNCISSHQIHDYTHNSGL
ncbi:hypothetical protein ACVWYN_002473 [Pedobacter sp. UYP24]